MVCENLIKNIWAVWSNRYRDFFSLSNIITSNATNLKLKIGVPTYLKLKLRKKKKKKFPLINSWSYLFSSLLIFESECNCIVRDNIVYTNRDCVFTPHTSVLCFCYPIGYYPLSQLILVFFYIDLPWNTLLHLFGYVYNIYYINIWIMNIERGVLNCNIKMLTQKT